MNLPAQLSGAPALVTQDGYVEICFRIMIQTAADTLFFACVPVGNQLAAVLHEHDAGETPALPGFPDAFS